jgi:hypothetical protein
VNPKAWAMALGAVAAYVPEPSVGAYAAVAVVFAGVNLPSVSVWAAAGQGLRRWLEGPGRLRLFNWGMAGLLVASLMAGGDDGDVTGGWCVNPRRGGAEPRTLQWADMGPRVGRDPVKDPGQAFCALARPEACAFDRVADRLFLARQIARSNRARTSRP